MTNLILIISVFFGGVLSFFSPCIFPIIPIYFGILSDGGSKKKRILNTFLFLLGLGLTFVALAFSFSFIGDIFNNQYLRIVAGIVIILFGLNQLELFKIKQLQQTRTVNVDINKYDKLKYGSSIKSFLLGLTFSLGWTPCVGPILATVLAVTADDSSVFGLFLMLVYTVGLSLPFIIFSLLSDDLLNKTSRLNKWLPVFKKISGVLIILMGILLLTNKLNIFI